MLLSTPGGSAVASGRHLCPASSGVFTRPCQYRPSVHACDV